jgi:tetratricopeptide (TPR) repeat protein
MPLTMKIRFIIPLLFLPLLQAFAVENKALTDSAAFAFKLKRYDIAVKYYEKVLASGQESADIYYNLGNCYYKQNALAKAIWYYEKARKLKPGDDDIRHNLRIANSRIVDKIDVVPELFYKRWWNIIANSMSVDDWARFTILVFVLFLVSSGFYLLMKRLVVRKIAFWVGIILFIASLFGYLFAWEKHNQLSNRKEAIIFIPAVPVKSSPDESSVDLFVIHEGTKVSLTDSIGGWYKVVILNGSVGWIPSEAFKSI